MSDARMSGTAYGTIVLHISPDAASGGPLSLVRNGDQIRLSVEKRQLELLVSDEELARRREEMSYSSQSRGSQSRGYARLYEEHILQADEGCDFDFLRAV